MTDDGIKFDTTELAGLAKGFIRIQGAALPLVDAVVGKGALNIKRDAVRRVSGLKHAPAYPRSISYDVFHTLTSAQAQIGPDKGKRQGALGNILEYGTVKNAPVPHLQPALDTEAPKFITALGVLAAQLLEKA